MEPDEACFKQVITKCREQRADKESEWESMLRYEMKAVVKGHRPEFVFSITDESDPFFFYQTSISEERFI